MARSPLFRTLTRVLRQAHAAARAGVPPDEIAAREREARAVSRRRFLELSAAAAALPLVASCSAPEIATPPSVVIVGGGMAGLHCAYRLKGLGVMATVHDAADRLGGRMFTDRMTFPDGMHCELGGELIDTDHQTMHDLAAELGIELLDYSTDDPSLEDLWADLGGVKLSPQDIATGYAPIAAKIDEALGTLTDQSDLFVYYNKPNGGEALDALSIKAWFDAIGAAGPVRTLLEVAYNIEYGLETHISNALNMLLLISTDAMKFEIYGASDERFHTKDGNDTYIQKLAARLDPAQIVTGDRLVRLIEASDGTYTLTFARGAGTATVKADHVVLALPFTMLRTVENNLDWPAAKKIAIHELGYGTNAKLMCGFSSRVWRSKYLSDGGVFSDQALQSTWETSRLQPGASGIITDFTGGQRGIDIGAGTPEDRLADFLGQFDKIFPGAQAASNGRVARFHWPTYPLTLGSYAAYKVGQYTRLAGAEIERFKNVHFAGEHTSLDAQGYMEGAALTGAMAAAEIGTDLGVAPPKGAMGGAAPRSRPDPAQRIMARADAARAGRRWKAAVRRSRSAG